MNIRDLVVSDAQGNRYRLVPIDMNRGTEIRSLVITPSAHIVATEKIAPTEPGPSPWSNFGNLLQQKRTAENLTQKALEEESGILQVNISAFENGRRIPRHSTKQKLILAWETLTGKSWAD